eukprot:6502190-Prymnesium_polylepis.1
MLRPLCRIAPPPRAGRVTAYALRPLQRRLAAPFSSGPSKAGPTDGPRQLPRSRLDNMPLDDLRLDELP